MRAEWGNDEGVSSAARHREKLVGWLSKTRAALDAFKPDFVLMWGDDQYENFKEDVVPPYCIAAYDRFKFATPPGNVWGETDKVYDLPGHRGGGQDAGDPADRGRLRHRLCLQAAAPSARATPSPTRSCISTTIARASTIRSCRSRSTATAGKVLAQRGGLPVFDREIPKATSIRRHRRRKRLFDLGAATARILAESPYRVALLASSGWSHAFLTGKNHYLWPDTPADRRMYEALRSSDWATWRAMTGAGVEDSGQQEILNWSCLAGAMSELNRKPQETGFVDTWIFNSSKAFLIAPPAWEQDHPHVPLPR